MNRAARRSAANIEDLTIPGIASGELPFRLPPVREGMHLYRFSFCPSSTALS